MSADRGGRIRMQGTLDDLARMHARPVDGSTRQLLDCQDVMARVQQNNDEHFVLEPRHRDAQIVARGAR